MEELSSSSSSAKPVVVRVKRKSNQDRLDAFWLAINERPSKRQLLDIEGLSISDSSAKGLAINERPSKRQLLDIEGLSISDSSAKGLAINERPSKRQLLDIEGLSISDSSAKVTKEVRMKKLLVQHVETLNVSEDAKDVLQSYLTNFTGSKDLKRKFEERRSMLKQHKQEQLRCTAIQKHEDQVRRARFEQIWKSRKEMMEAGDDSLHEICHLYDVVQVDTDDKKFGKVQKQEHVSFEDKAILCNYLPLLREYVAEAAKEIESDLRSYAFGGSVDDGMTGEQSAKTDYVYDIYTVKDDTSGTGDQEAGITYPLVQVYEEDYYDGPSDSEYATDDSNAEDNPLNDYPDEESSGDEEDADPFDHSQYEDEVVEVSGDDEDDWKWTHR